MTRPTLRLLLMLAGSLGAAPTARAADHPTMALRVASARASSASAPAAPVAASASKGAGATRRPLAEVVAPVRPAASGRSVPKKERERAPLGLCDGG